MHPSFEYRLSKLHAVFYIDIFPFRRSSPAGWGLRAGQSCEPRDKLGVLRSWCRTDNAQGHLYEE